MSELTRRDAIKAGAVFPAGSWGAGLFHRVPVRGKAKNLPFFLLRIEKCGKSALWVSEQNVSEARIFHLDARARSAWGDVVKDVTGIEIEWIPALTQPTE